jgi:hypothetical protein
MIGIKKKLNPEIARLFGKNKSSIRELRKIKEKIRAGFYVAPQNTNVTARAR